MIIHAATVVSLYTSCTIAVVSLYASCTITVVSLHASCTTTVISLHHVLSTRWLHAFSLTVIYELHVDEIISVNSLLAPDQNCLAAIMYGHFKVVFPTFNSLGSSLSCVQIIITLQDLSIYIYCRTLDQIVHFIVILPVKLNVSTINNSK